MTTALNARNLKIDMMSCILCCDAVIIISTNVCRFGVAAKKEINDLHCAQIHNLISYPTYWRSRDLREIV